jgi:hypothetical protein
MGQNYSSKYNSLYGRYEYFDSNGNMIGYKKYNSLYDRWEYTDLSRQNKSNSNSYYNLDLIQQSMLYKQQQGDRNLNLIYDKDDEIQDILSKVAEKIGGFNSKQKNEVSEYVTMINSMCKGDLSNNGYVRKIISTMDKWKRYFRSWGNSNQNRNSEKTQLNNDYSEKTITIDYSDSGKIVTIDYSAIIWSDPDISKGKHIGEAKGRVKVIGKAVGTDFYKIEFNGLIGYIHKSYIY